MLAAGVLAALFFGATGGLWAVTGEFTRWGGNLLQLAGVDPSNWAYFKIVKLKGQPWDRSDGWLVIGMFLGALISALASGSFRIRWPARRRRIAQALVGGILSGFGARRAMGCNLASFFTGLPQFSFHAWLFIVGMAAGAYGAARIIVKPWFTGAPKVTERGTRQFGFRRLGPTATDMLQLGALSRSPHRRWPFRAEPTRCLPASCWPAQRSASSCNADRFASPLHCAISG
jgi:hypothetical protein